jgi:hypothetical protein
MKTSPKLVFALLALASCAAGAETYYSGQADQERRDRNREEALQNYHADNGSASTTTRTRRDRDTLREDTHEGAQKVRRGTHEVADSTRRVSHKTANAGRRIGHKTAVKAREITNRAEAKFGPSPNTKVDAVGEKK